MSEAIGSAAASGLQPADSSEHERLSTIESVMMAWKALDLTGKQASLDQASLEMTERHEACLAARKDLTQATKDFRKLNDEEKLTHMTALLKKYQDEVDVQTRRARAAEKAFVSLYRDLYVAPDPVPALASALHAAESSIESDSRVVELQREVAGLEEELSKLNNQDITIRQLESRLLSMESSVEDLVNERVKTKELELRNQLDVELASVRDKETQADMRIRQADDAVLAAQNMADEAQSQLMELRNRMDDMLAGHKYEGEILSLEVERLQAELREAKKLSRPMSQTSTSAAKLESDEAARALVQMEARAIEAEAEVIRQQATIAALTADVRAWEDASSRHTTLHTESMQKLQSELDEKASEVSVLRKELGTRPSLADVASLRQQLAAYEALYFNVEDSDSVQGSNLQGSEGEGGIHTSVHGIVMKRVRQLESAVTKAARENQELTNALEMKHREVLQSQERLNDQRVLLENLERQLETRTVTAIVTEKSSTQKPSSGFSHDAQLLSLLAGDGNKEAEDGLLGTADTPAAEDATSLVSILKGQRDRFRAKMLELESQRDVLLRENDDLKAKAERLVGDNVTLFEKIKYLESYAQVPQSALASNQYPEVRLDVDSSLSGPGMAHVPGLPDFRTPGSQRLSQRGQRSAEDVETTYQSLYEDKVNPFADFNRKEKMRRYGNLSAAEKITLNSTRLFMASKFARTFVFFYSVALHCLVFATLYHFTHVAHH